MWRRVFIAHVEEQRDLARSIGEALEWLAGRTRVFSHARVFLKPNLTWREPRAGVTTTPVFIEAVVTMLKAWTDQILIGEADGGYHSFKAEEACRTHGLYGLAERFGVKVVNLSKGPAEVRTVEVAGKPVCVELPKLLLHEVDVFVSLPVPKVHVMTEVSLGFKNQWGCQPGTMRLRNHPDFAWKVLAINKLVQPKFVLFDGTYFLDKSGPMAGEPVRMDLFIAANDVGAGDLVCCEIMGIDPQSVPHLRRAERVGMMPRSIDDVILNQPLEPFKTHQFRLRRSLINYIALAAFHSKLGTRLLYDSPVAAPLHEILYALRRNPAIGRLLYGAISPPRPDVRKSGDSE